MNTNHTNHMEIVIFVLVAVAFVTMLIVGMAKLDKNYPRWKRVYFYLLAVVHSQTHVDYIEVQNVLMRRYKLTPTQAKGCVDHVGDYSSDWYELNIPER